MATMVTAFKNILLNHVLAAAAFTPPVTWYIGLFTVLPDDNGAGGVEVAGGSYARVAVTANSTNFPVASGGVISNGVTFTFPTATADWGTVIGFGLFDAATVGNLRIKAAVNASKVVLNGDTVRFTGNTLVFSLS
jgi:hypothetical protein